MYIKKKEIFLQLNLLIISNDRKVEKEKLEKENNFKICENITHFVKFICN